jgi:hypothetical protein
MIKEVLWLLLILELVVVALFVCFFNFFEPLVSLTRILFYFLATKDIMKVLPINERMVATMAGGAADCQYWIAIVSRYCKFVFYI